MLDTSDATREKNAVDALLADYREQLVSGRLTDPVDRLCGEAALTNEVQNAMLGGDIYRAQDLIKKYSPYVRNDDNKRILLLAEVGIDDRLGEYTKAMIALNKAKAFEPDARQKRRYVAPPYDVLETMLQGNAKEAGKTIDEKQIQQQLALGERVFLANSPNPFNPSTVISYRLPDAGTRFIVSLKVYDILGREVAILVEGQKEAGFHTARFNGSRLAGGVYFTRLVVQPQGGGQIVQVKKMVLLK
jgi:tetratricopeptide (TPR) repeat protein